MAQIFSHAFVFSGTSLDGDPQNDAAGETNDDFLQGYNAPGAPGDMGRSQVITGFSSADWPLYGFTTGATAASNYVETTTPRDDGNDNILGGQGSDTLLGGGGNDFLSGGPPGGEGNNDVLFGGWGDDVLLGGNAARSTDNGQDVLKGGPGDDLLFGSDFSDIIDGGSNPGGFATGDFDIAQYRGVLDLASTRSSYTVSVDPTLTGRFVVSGPDATDRLTGVEALEMRPQTPGGPVTGFYVQADLIGKDRAAQPNTFELPDCAFRIELHRYANGGGFTRAYRVGESDPFLEKGDVAGLLKGKSPVVMNGGLHDPREFAFDDLTPAPAGTYDAVLRMDADTGLDADTGKAPRPDLRGVDIQLNDIPGTGSDPDREAVAIHVGNWTRDSEGCYVVGSADLADLLRPILTATDHIPTLDDEKANTALRSPQINFEVGTKVAFRPTILPTANVTGVDGAGPPAPVTWQSAIKVQIIDEEPVTQPRVTVSRLVQYADRPGVYAAELKLSHAVSKELAFTIVNTGGGTLHTGTATIAAGTTTGYVVFSAQAGSDISFNITGVSVPDHPYDNPLKLTALILGRSEGAPLSTTLHTATAAVVSNDPVSIDTGYGGTHYVVTDTSDLGGLPATAGYDIVTVVSLPAAPAAAAMTFALPTAESPAAALPDGIEKLVVQGDGPVHVIGNGLDNVIVGGGGGDLIGGGLGADLLIGGGGGDTFEGTLAELDGDAIADFDVFSDSLLIKGSVFGTSAVTTASGSVIVQIDANLDGAVDSTVTLELNDEEFAAAGLTAVVQAEGGSTRISFKADSTNTAPTAVVDGYSATEDTPLAVGGPGVLGNDTDPDGNTLTAELVAGPSHGTLTFSASGAFTYTPTANYSGPDSFTYRASDGSLTSDPTTTSLIVAAVNDAPSAANGTASTVEETPLTIDVGSLVADVETADSALIVTATVPSAQGTVSVAGTLVTFTPKANFNGLASISYTVKDGPGGEALTSNATINVAVAPVNDAPTAASDTVAAKMNTPLSIPAATLLSNDADVDGDTLSITSASGAVHGDVAFDAIKETIAFTPEPGYAGPASFSYGVSDGQGGSATGSVSVTIDPVSNLPPIATPDAYTVTEDTTLNVGAAGVLTNDSDPEGSALKAVLIRGPGHGTLTLNANGSFSYKPAANYSGGDSFSYSASDSALPSANTTVTLKVTPVNDVPVTSNGSVSGAAGAPITGSLPRAVDPDSLALTYALVPNSAHNGAAAVAPGGGFTFTPNPGIANYGYFYFTVSDGVSTTAPALMRVLVVNPANQKLTETSSPDILRGASGSDTIEGLGAPDQPFGRGGPDSLSGGDGYDKLHGEDSSDALSGGSAKHLLDGGAGANWLIGGSSNDASNGGADADLFVHLAGAGPGDTDITAFELGLDKLRLLDGVSVSWLTHVDVDSVVTMKGGNVVQLLGVSGVSDWSTLVG